MATRSFRLILGSLLETRKTQAAYSTLIYNKGALILRMIHSPITGPATGNGGGVPMPPTGMKLDPQHWVLSEKTESN